MHYKLRPFVIVFALLTAALSAGPALAHGYLLRSIPEDRAVLEQAPARLQYWFSEPLEADFSSLRVLNVDGAVIAEGGVALENPALLTVRLPRDLPDGAYIADMRIAFASDGHLIAQRRVFFIGQASESISGESADTEANALEVIWRAMAVGGSLLIFGVFTSYSAVLVPAWSNPRYPAGLLPPRLMNRLSTLVTVALLVTLVGNALALVQQAMLYFEADAGRVLSGQLWETVRSSTRFGDFWNWRMLLLGAVALFFIASRRVKDNQPEWVRPFWSSAGWAAALMLATFTVVSHAAGSLVWPWVAMFVNWVHTLAVGLWAGGLAVLALTLPVALQPLTGETPRLVLLAVMQRFSRLATACLFIVISTGIYSSSNWIYTPRDLQSSYGVALSLKVLLVIGLVAVGALHHIALRPGQYTRFAKLGQRVSGFIPSLRLEMVFAVLVIGAMALLSSTPPPVPEFIQENIPSPRQRIMVNGYTITQSITPGGPGVNTYDTLVTQGDQPVEGLTMRAQIVEPASDRQGDWLPAEDAEAGLYVAAGGEINQAGRWWSLVEFRDSGGQVTRAAFDWSIDNAAAVQLSRPPGVLTVLAFISVLVAIGFALYPAARVFYQRLDLRPQLVAIVLFTVLVTVGLSAVGFWVDARSRAQYELTLNPLPTRLNPTLPTQESLERGAVLFTAGCDWAERPVLNQLIEALNRTRDEALYNAVATGWRGLLPACTAEWSDAQRWDVVNYVRQLDF
jgi:copper transport protein